MDKKNLSDISSGLRSAYQKAGEAVKKHNIDYAIDLYKSIVKKEPGFIQAREELRKVEKEFTEKIGGFAKLTGAFKGKFAVGKIKAMIKKDPVAAMGMAEDLLAKNLSNPNALNAMAEAATVAGADEFAIEAYEIFREYAPKNEKNLRNLAAVYKKVGEGTKVLTIFQEISDMHPNDLGIKQELKAAAALASMEQGHWDEEGDFRDKIKDESVADQMEKEDRIARTEDDIADMIARYEKAISEGEDTVDNYRKLADYYHRSGKYDEAIAGFEKIMEKMGVLDLLIDGKIERAYLAKIDNMVKEAEGNGEDTAELQEARYNYRLERAVERVNAYPNDNKLRYELALVYYDGQYIDEALEQFQIAQRAPKYKLTALAYMGRCFHHKGQLDLAAEQLEHVVEEIKGMGKDKKEALYDLGTVYVDMDESEKAGKCFKQIYQSDINYKDVAERIKVIYG